MGWGAVFTGALQSSSVMVSFLLPFVATGKVSVRQAFPFIMGANLGTTVTALIASIAKSDVALSIAIVHVLINLIGVLLIYPIPPFREGTVWLAKKIGLLMVRQRLVGFVYMILIFFIIPFVLIYVSKGQSQNDKTGARYPTEFISPTSSSQHP
jgi:sodium-dependent phosphate cotransporter